MEGKYRIEITDLIEQAVENAIARRNGSLHSEDTLSTLSDEEAEKVGGGLVAPGLKSVLQPIKPPIIIVGIVIQPKNQLLA